MENVPSGRITATLIKDARMYVAGLIQTRTKNDLLFLHKIKPVIHHDDSPILKEKLDEAFKQAEGDEQWWTEKNQLSIHYRTDERSSSVNIEVNGLFCNLLKELFPGRTMKLWCSNVNLDNSETKINRNELIWKREPRVSCLRENLIMPGVFSDEDLENDLSKDEYERCHFAGSYACVNISYINIGEIGIVWSE